MIKVIINLIILKLRDRNSVENQKKILLTFEKLEQYHQIHKNKKLEGIIAKLCVDLKAIINNIKMLKERHSLDDNDSINYTRELEEFQHLYPSKYYKYNTVWEFEIQAYLAKYILKICYTLPQYDSEIARLKEGKRLLEMYGSQMPGSPFMGVIRRSGLTNNNNAQFFYSDIVSESTRALYPTNFKQKNVIIPEGEGPSVDIEAYKLSEENSNKYILESGEEKHLNTVSWYTSSKGEILWVAFGSFTSNKDKNTISLADKQYINDDVSQKGKEQRYRLFKHLIHVLPVELIKHEKGTAFVNDSHFQGDDGQSFDVHGTILEEMNKPTYSIGLRKHAVREPHVFNKHMLNELNIKTIFRIVVNKLRATALFLKKYSQFYYYYGFTVMGCLLVFLYIYVNFLRQRIPRDIPFDLTEFRFYILVGICFSYIYIIYRTLRPKISNIYISKMLQIICMPFVYFDSFLKNNRYLKPYYDNFFNNIIDDLTLRTVLEYVILIYIFYLIPRIILLTIFCGDIFIAQRLEIFYYFIFIAIVALTYQYFIYSILYLQKYYYYTLESLYSQIAIIDENSIHKSTWEGKNPKAIYHDKRVSIKEYFKIQLENCDPEIDYIGYTFSTDERYQQYSLNTYNNKNAKLTSEDYDILEMEPQLRNLELFLERYAIAIEINYIPKVKLYIYCLYLIAWSYILISSFATVKDFNMLWYTVSIINNYKLWSMLKITLFLLVIKRFKKIDVYYD